ncbi:hypothetical protein LTR62_000200 [Meristemomyces frigidus]|uniref:Uncharacterized protein n=1 Tax=Meristemomyces frigidus TaxID=1508187 RepID=A0AAN7TYZ4_9PEZI|nr:hypothetical protein LTR62_000200 [Meristemomyces frigidus]
MSDPAPPAHTLTVTAAVTPTDHAALITLACWLCLVAGVLCTMMRVHLRWPLRSLAGADDILCGVTTLLAIVQTSIVLRAAARDGLGRTANELSQSENDKIGKVNGINDYISCLDIFVTAFGLRLFVLPITILHLVSLSNVNANDISFTYVLPDVLTQVELHSNLIATTLPCLRLFLTAWNTSFMNIGLEEIDPQAFAEHVTSHTRSYELSSMQHKQSNKGTGMGTGSKQNSNSNNNAWSRSNMGRNTTRGETSKRGEKDDDAASDSSQQAIVVRQTVRVDRL